MAEELKKGKSGSEIIVYPDAKHGLLAEYRPSYYPKASQDAWKRMIDWFEIHGAA